MSISATKAVAALLAAAASLCLSSCGGSLSKVISENIYEYSQEGFRIYWIGVNAGKQNNPVSLFPDTPEGLAEELGLAEGIPASMSVFLLQEGGKNILFDTGMNAKDALIPALGSLGVTPESIETIFITHLHGDHIGGMLADGAPAFPNAKVYLARQEYEGWMNMGERGAQAAATLEPYKDNLVLFGFGDELPYSIKAIDIKGHTPGHTAFQKGHVLVAGDIMHGVALQIEHPELCATYDSDKENSVASRKMVIELAKNGHFLLCGMHFPQGGVIDYRK